MEPSTLQSDSKRRPRFLAKAAIQTKEDKIFKVGVGVNNWVKDGVNGTFTPYVDAGIYWKIKVRR
jgi:hypothetical protein